MKSRLKHYCVISDKWCVSFVLMFNKKKLKKKTLGIFSYFLTESTLIHISSLKDVISYISHSWVRSFHQFVKEVWFSNRIDGIYGHKIDKQLFSVVELGKLLLRAFIYIYIYIYINIIYKTLFYRNNILLWPVTSCEPWQLV